MYLRGESAQLIRTDPDRRLEKMTTGFLGFYSLPTEIRSMIWTYALPECRVFEIFDKPDSDLKTPPEYGLMFANRRNEPPPTLASVCVDSRTFVLRQYKPLMLNGTTKYIDFSRDILLFEQYLLIRRLLRALRFLSDMPYTRDQICRLAFGASFSFDAGITHPTLNLKLSSRNSLLFLNRLRSFPRLRSLLFIIHQEFRFSDPAHPPLQPLLLHHSYPIKISGPFSIKSDRDCCTHRNELLYYPLKAKSDENNVNADMEDLREEDGEDWRHFRPRDSEW